MLTADGALTRLARPPLEARIAAPHPQEQEQAQGQVQGQAQGQPIALSGSLSTNASPQHE